MPIIYVTNLCPFVVVKVGNQLNGSKPGNRGRRDSQMLRYINRVHFDLAMSLLELEIYRQMRNVIGIDSAFYEYIFTVDADTVRHLMIFITDFLGGFRLSHLQVTLSTIWSFPVHTTPRLFAYDQAHERRRLTVDCDKSTNTTPPTIYPRLSRVFSDPSPVYLVALLSTTFLRPIKEG
jgi:Chitin synthase